jgi:hypothetical protein
MRATLVLLGFVCLLSAGCDCGGDGPSPVEELPIRGCRTITEGCPCQGEPPASCFDGNEAVAQAGACAEGTRSCLDGFWGACEGQVLPGAELCGDGLDNDCDGSSDEGARCDCEEGCLVEDDECFAAGQATGLEQDDCDLLLGMRQSGGQWAWIANTQDSSLSRIDTVRAVEVARFATVGEGAHGAPSPSVACEAAQVLVNGPTGNCPSRTAVAGNGDAFVANRAFGAQGTVTRVAAELERCVDRDGDGTIETSADLDGDSTISADPADGEILGSRDECLLWTTPVGGVAGVPRALALAPPRWPREIGEVWVGVFFERSALVLDPDSGEITDSLALDIQPYGAAPSPDGRIWFTETDWESEFGLQAVDAEGHAVEPPIEPPAFDGCAGSYGIAIDEEGRVWRGSSPCAGVFRYDPATEDWDHFVPDATGESLGVAADGEGRIWAVFFRNQDRQRIARAARLDGETGETDRWYDLRGLVGDAWGVDVDGEGDVWVVSREDDQAIQIDPLTGEMTAVAVGDEPYTYSDFTGAQLRMVTDPSGRWDQLFEGCPVGPTRWFDVAIEAEAPVGAGVRIRHRVADDLATLTTLPWSDTHQRTASLRGEGGRFLEVRVELWSSDDGWTPTLASVSAAHSCPPEVE